MTGVITLLDQPRTLDALGRATDALIYFYLTGTTVLAPIYNDAALTDPAINPIELAAGQIFPDIFLDPSVEYRRRIIYGDGSIHDVDPLDSGDGGVLAQLASSSGADMVGFKQDGSGAIVRNIGVEVREIHTNVRAYGATGDGVTDDYAALQAAIDAAGVGGTVWFPRTATNIYNTSQALKFYPGQTWAGSGGQGILLPVTRINLTAAVDDAMIMPADLETITEGLRFHGILFDADEYADRTVWFYNTMYSTIERCGIVNAKANGVALDMDADTSKKCYFNKIEQVRAYANSVSGTAIRFTRGANSNQVIGGAARSSYIGMSFDTLSSGNTILAVDMEENTYRHFYVDSANNSFISNRMENAPVGFEITANGNGTYTVNQQWARSCVIPFTDASILGTRLEQPRPGDNTDPGLLWFGSARFNSSYNSTNSILSYDPLLSSGTSNALVNLFRNTTTTGLKQLIIYRGDSSSVVSYRHDAASGDRTVANAAAGQIRQRLLRPSAPSTCAQGDICTIQSPALGAPASYIGVATNTWGLYAQAGVAKAATASRPTLAAKDAGAMFFDTTLAAPGKPIWWTGTEWVDATGTAA